MNQEIYDVAVIGGGPVGIFAAYYSAMRSLKSVLVESMPALGGQPTNLYAQKKILDVPAVFGIRGSDLTEHLTNTNPKFGYDKKLNTTVNSFEKIDDHYRISTNNSDIFAKAIIIATGNGPFKPRKLACKYDQALEGHQLNYFVNNINSYKDKDVLVAGGGDSAVDWALEINKIAHSTAILHRRNQFRALESSVSALNKSNINVITPDIIKGVDKIDNGKIKVTYKMVKNDNLNSIIVDKLLINYGMTSDSRLLRNWGLKLHGPFISVDSEMHTNLEHVYGVGDVVDYPGKQRLIALGFAEAPIAVSTAINELYPDKANFGHSSSLLN